MERYDAYKDSSVKWIGMVPEKWGVLYPKKLFSLRKERALPEDVQLTASQKNGIVTQEEYTRLENQRVVQVITGEDILKHVEAGDFVISMRSFQGGLEYSTISGKISSAYVMLYATDREMVCDGYYKHLFKSTEYIQALQSTSNLVRDGQALRYANFVQVYLPHPPISEQRAIADYLDAKTAEIDALVADCEREVGLLQEYRKAVISEAVTKGLDPDAPMKDSGIEWIGEIPKKWSIDRLSSCIVSISSGVSVNGAAYPAADNELGVLKTSSVYHDIFTATENKQVNLDEADRVKCPVVANRLIVSRMNTPEWVGACGYVERDFPNLFLPDRLWQIEIGNKASCKYVYYWLQSRGVKSWISVIAVGTSGSMKNIAQREFAQLPIALPPLDEQIEIVECLEAKTVEIDALVEAKQTMVGKLREYRRSLVSEAVTGKFKVPGVDE